MKNMVSFGGLLKMLPGMPKISDQQLQEAEVKLKQTEAMIDSMTPDERRNPELLASSPSRRQRIARGSGYRESDVSKLVNDFQKMRNLMQQMGQGGLPGMPGMGGGPMSPFGGGGRPSQPGWRGYNSGGVAKKKPKKEKKKKGFGQL